MFKKIYKRIKRHLLSPQKYALSLGLKIGKGSVILTKDLPSEGYLIEIGDYVRLSPQVSIFTHGALWSIRQYHKDSTVDQFGKVKIGSYSFIGAKAIILPGVTIGERCIVASGSVVTKSISDGCMVAGNPARFVGYTEDYYKEIKEKYDFGCNNMPLEEKKQFLLSQPDDLFVKKPYIQVPD